jgi:TolA-binding protein
MASDKITYKGLATSELLSIARDALRAVESEHFRLTLAIKGRENISPPEQARVDDLERQITEIQAEVDKLSKE